MVTTIVCSRDGLGVAKMANGKLRHAGGRWTGKSCGQEPDPVPWVVFEMRRKRLDAEAEAEIEAWRNGTGRYAEPKP